MKMMIEEMSHWYQNNQQLKNILGEIPTGHLETYIWIGMIILCRF